MRHRGAAHTVYLDALIADLVTQAATDLESGTAVLDVGSGDSPPFRDRLSGWRFVDCDLDAGHCHAVAEALPFRGSCFAGSVSFAVFEHLPDPAAALREAARVTRPGGFLLLVTHGVYPYHPVPNDYWRWTGAGLRRLVGERFIVDRVVPIGGVLLCLCVVLGFYVDAASRRLPAAIWLTRALNALARRFDRYTMRADGDEDAVGALRVGYLVIAHVPAEHESSEPAASPLRPSSGVTR